jgi:hypothetical protein
MHINKDIATRAPRCTFYLRGCTHSRRPTAARAACKSLGESLSPLAITHGNVFMKSLCAYWRRMDLAPRSFCMPDWVLLSVEIEFYVSAHYAYRKTRLAYGLRQISAK